MADEDKAAGEGGEDQAPAKKKLSVVMLALIVAVPLLLIGGGEGTAWSNTPDDIAARCGTIGYEILTSLGRRHARAYGGV
jgi:hypothetical protein